MAPVLPARGGESRPAAPSRDLGQGIQSGALMPRASAVSFCVRTRPAVGYASHAEQSGMINPWMEDKLLWAKEEAVAAARAAAKAAVAAAKVREGGPQQQETVPAGDARTRLLAETRAAVAAAKAVAAEAKRIPSPPVD